MRKPRFLGKRSGCKTGHGLPLVHDKHLFPSLDPTQKLRKFFLGFLSGNLTH